MRTGILTYHRVVNIGSAMQAYCLHQFLSESSVEGDVEIVNYYPATARAYNRSRILNRRRWKLKVDWGFMHTQRLLWDMLLERCSFSRKECITDSVEAGRQFLEEMGYNQLVVGSDTVFQLGSAIGGQFVAAPAPPNLYFLPGVTGVKKVAFAASMDPFQLDQLDGVTPAMMSALKDFDMITYRDEPCAEALQKLGIEDERLHFMADPTIMYDFASDFSITPLAGPEDRVCGVAIADRGIAMQMMDLARGLGYQPVDLLYSTWSETPLTSAVPHTLDNLLSLYGSFSLLLTDRFHGSIFGLKLSGCPVVCFEDEGSYPDGQSKMRDLFRRLGIEGMIVRPKGIEFDVGWLAGLLESWEETPETIGAKFEALRQTGLATYRQVF